MIARSAKQASRLIEDLVDSAGIEAGALGLQLAAMSPWTCLRAVIAGQGSLIEAAGLEFVVSVPDELPEILADCDRLIQVLENLLGNAIKFTPAPGQVELGAKVEPGFLRVWVADTGIGIAGEDAPLIFDRFWQGDRRRSGAGLGLAICQAIVQGHGGQISWEPRAAGGSKFSFNIPRAMAAAELPTRIRSMQPAVSPT